MEILVILRNLYDNPDPFEGEKLLCDSDINVLTEACDLRDSLVADTDNAVTGAADSSEAVNATPHSPSVTALLISESQADYEGILKKAASYGADKVVHAACANTFGPLIAEIIKGLEPMPNLVFFGRLAYDGDSVNIATQTAENLDWHRAIYSTEVLEVSFGGEDSTLTFKKAMEDGSLATTEVPLPAVVHSVRKRGLRGQAKVSDIIRAYGETRVESISKNAIAAAKEKALSGSSLPTPIQEIPPYINKGEMVDLKGTSDVDTAANIIDTLKKLGFEPKA